MPWLDRLLWRCVDRLLRAAVREGSLTFQLPDGSEHHYGSPCEHSSVPGAEPWRGLPPLNARVRVRNSDMFYLVVTRHDTGLGEAYIRGDFEVDDLGALLAVITANATTVESNRGVLGLLNWVGGQALRLAHLSRPNTVEGSRRNISEHYDAGARRGYPSGGGTPSTAQRSAAPRAGNAMYKLFLDPTLTYSAGVHRKGDSLERAQLRKLDALINDARITAASHVLEIGCGWGSCAIRAAQVTGCRWTGKN